MELIKSNIQSVINLSDEKLSAVTSKLQEIGVENVDDLACVVETDLTQGNLLSAIPARKLIKAWSLPSQQNSSSPVIVQQSTSLVNTNQLLSMPSSSTPSTSTVLSAPTTTTPLTNLDNQASWIHNFDVLMLLSQARYQSESISLRQSIDNLYRAGPLTASQRNEIVRCVADRMFKECRTPSRSSLNVVAEKLIDKFPVFKDVIDEVVIGPGYVSLRNQIENRLTYLRRPLNVQRKSAAIRRRILETDNETVQKRQHRDGYGCINFLPVTFPEGETEETLSQKQSSLKDWFASNSGSDTDITSYMAATFSLQRQDLVGQHPLPVCNIVAEWPYLLEMRHLNQHLFELLGVDIVEKMESSLVSKKDSIIQYLQCQQRSTARLKQRMQMMDISVEPAIGLISALMSYFGENEEILFRGFDVSNYFVSSLPLTVFLVLLRYVHFMRITKFNFSFINF